MNTRIAVGGRSWNDGEETIKLTPESREQLSRLTGKSPEKVEEVFRKTKVLLTPLTKNVDVAMEDGTSRTYEVSRVGGAPIETRSGNFWQYCVRVNDEWEDYRVVYKGVVDKELLMPVPDERTRLMRIDSGCFTGQVLNEKTCTCADELQTAMEALEKNKGGMVINIPKQDGWGFGPEMTLATIYMQKELDINTVTAAVALLGDGKELNTKISKSLLRKIDIRTYDGAIAVLKFFGIQGCCIEMMTHNPDKMNPELFRNNGYEIERTEIAPKPTEYNIINLKAKEEYLGHLIPLDKNNICGSGKGGAISRGENPIWIRKGPV